MIPIFAQYIFDSGKEYGLGSDMVKYVSTVEVESRLKYPCRETFRWPVFKTKKGIFVVCEASTNFWQGKLDITLEPRFWGKSVKHLLSQISDSVKAKVQTTK